VADHPAQARGVPPRLRRVRSGGHRALRRARRGAADGRHLLDLQQAEGSFDAWIWRFVGGKPIAPARRGRADIPARTPLSDELSKELKRRGFTFVGSTIVYAFMQAAGLVNDHMLSCFRRPAIVKMGKSLFKAA
jgi:3-methyladenine DNA glycosylase Tag